MAVKNPSLMNALVKTDASPKKGRVDFEAAMNKMGLTSVFDIVRMAEAEFARELAIHSDADAKMAYSNATAYATLLARLYREHKTSSGSMTQSLASRSGVRALVPVGPTFQKLFNEKWDEFCKVGALAAIDSPVAYLSALWTFIQQLEATSTDSKRILLDERRPDLKDLMITQDSTHTPRPMLEIVNNVLGSNLRTYLDSIPVDKPKSINQVLSERRYPFELPYNFYHHQCQLGLSGSKPGLGEYNYRASLALPLANNAINDYGRLQTTVVQAQQLLTGLSPQQQKLLTETSPFTTHYVTRSQLIEGWESPGTTHLWADKSWPATHLLPLEQDQVGAVEPKADVYDESQSGGSNVAEIIFSNGSTQTKTYKLTLNGSTPTELNTWKLNYIAAAQTWGTMCSRVQYLPVNNDGKPLPEAEEPGYVARFHIVIATRNPKKTDEPLSLAKRSFTITLNGQYTLNPLEQKLLKQSYGVDAPDIDSLNLSSLEIFMQRTGLNAEHVEMLLSQRTYAVRLSPNYPGISLQHPGVPIPAPDGPKFLPFPHASHYGACYVNGTGTDRYDSVLPATPDSIICDQFDNSMGLVQEKQGETTAWRITKTSLNRFDRLQRMVRLQRWTQIPFAKLDTLIISAIRAEGETNLDMELNQNTLRVLGVYRYLNQRFPIDPQEFAAFFHDLTPYASGKEMPLFDQVFNRVQLFDKPLILDQTPFALDATDHATQLTLLQLCAGLGLQPTEDSLLLIARETAKITPLKRDLGTVSSLFRQARIAQLLGLSVDELMTLAVLLGGLTYKRVLASGSLRPVTATTPPDILDVLMQLVWAVDWLTDSQQTVAQLQQRLGPNVPFATVVDDVLAPGVSTFEYPPLSVPELARLAKTSADAERSKVTEAQVAALGLPAETDNAKRKAELDWFEILKSKLIDDNGLSRGLDRELTLVDDAPIWIKEEIEKLLKPMNLKVEVKQICEEKLFGLMLAAHDTQTQVFETLFQETAKLPSELTVAMMEWAGSSVYSVLVEALKDDITPALIEHFQRVARHAEIALSLRLSNSALRMFVVNPNWLGAVAYPPNGGEPSLADLYLLERFSHWLHHQSESEDVLLNYFRLANPVKSSLKNKALRQAASETANIELARLLGWSEEAVTTLASHLPEKRAGSMAEVDWIRRCQASCQVSGLSAKDLLNAIGLSDSSSLDEWKKVGDAAMAAARSASLPSIANA